MNSGPTRHANPYRVRQAPRTSSSSSNLSSLHQADRTIFNSYKFCPFLHCGNKMLVPLGFFPLLIHLHLVPILPCLDGGIRTFLSANSSANLSRLCALAADYSGDRPLLCDFGAYAHVKTSQNIPISRQSTGRAMWQTVFVVIVTSHSGLKLKRPKQFSLWVSSTW